MRPVSILCVAIVLIATSFNSYDARAADHCGSLQTQSAMTACYQQATKVADQHLAGTYKKIMDRLSNNAGDDLKSAQKAWVSYRSKECAFRASGVAGGSVHASVVAQCLADMARARTKELETVLNCKEGDLSCP